MGETISARHVWDYREDIDRLASVLCEHLSENEEPGDSRPSPLLKAATLLEDFQGEASLRIWLDRVVSIESAMRREKQDADFEEIVSRGWSRTDDDSAPQRLARDSESKREILRALWELPERYRCVLLLKDGRGLSLKAVAALLERSVPSVKSSLLRARRALRQRVAS